MEKVESIRGKQKIMHNGRGNVNGVSECKAKIKVKNDVVVGFLHEHTHAPDSARCEVLQVRQNITKRAVETEKTHQQILDREMQNLSEGASVQMVPI